VHGYVKYDHFCKTQCQMYPAILGQDLYKPWICPVLSDQFEQTAYLPHYVFSILLVP